MAGKSLLVVTILLLTCMTVQLQIAAISWPHVEGGRQVERHRAVLQGKANSPWQYRVLPEYLLVVMKRGLQALKIPKARASAFVLLRYAQNILIFYLLYVYIRCLGLRPGESLLGIIMFAWVMAQAYYNSDLQFSTYFDVIFYLIAGLALLKKRFVVIPVLTFVAALNRETSGLIPMLCLSCIFLPDYKQHWKQIVTASVSGFLLYALAYWLLRFIWGSRDLIVVYSNSPGWEMFYYNVTRSITWLHLAALLSAMPLLLLVGFRRCPPFIKVATLTIIPAWMLIHLFMSVLAEARLMLVPVAMSLLPATLFICLRQEREERLEAS